MNDGFQITGFQIVRLGQNLFDNLRAMVNRSFVRALSDYGCGEKWIHKSVYEYGCGLKDELHKAVWTKANRILPRDDVNELMCGDFYDEIKSIIGDFRLTDEEALGYGNIYWRIVRPGRSQDVGPIHRDEWFWDLNPERKTGCYGYERIKCWIPLQSERKKNLLMVEAGSHKRNDVVYIKEFRDGINKPSFDANKCEAYMEMLDMQCGEAVFFHDRLLHCGSLNVGNLARVSIEFTALVEETNGTR